MKDLNEATERICELKGSLVALDALVPALIESLPAAERVRLTRTFDAHAEVARTVMLHADVSDLVLAAFERDVARNRVLIGREAPSDTATSPAPVVDALLLAATRISTFEGTRALTSASGFFFRRGGRLFLVSNRHVFADSDTAHFPDRIEFGLHRDPVDMTRHVQIPLELYRDGLSLWRQASDSGGTVDVAAIEVPQGHLPDDAFLQAFDESHLEPGDEPACAGDALAIVGFPLGFHDTLHHLAIARSASIASAFGVRFQGNGYFLTDARTHRGSSGSPVVRRRSQPMERSSGPRSWQLVGVHSTRMDMGGRDESQDESLGLNCAWYADVLMALTDER